MYTITKRRRSSKPPPMLLIWRWICYYPARPENTKANQPITNLKPRTFANTTVTSKKVEAFTRRFIFCSNLYDVSGMIQQPISSAFFCGLLISLTMSNLSFRGHRTVTRKFSIGGALRFNRGGLSPCKTFLFVFPTVAQKLGRIENFPP